MGVPFTVSDDAENSDFLNNENAWALTCPPATCPLSQYSCPKVVSRRHAVTSWCRAVTSGVMTKWLCAIYIGHTIGKSRKITFFKIATLTFDLWPWPSNLSEVLSKAMFLPNFRSVAQTVQSWERWQTDRQTDAHTDWTDSIPLQTPTGGRIPPPALTDNPAQYALNVHSTRNEGNSRNL